MEPCGAFVFFAPEQLFELFRCYAWLIWFRQRTALLEPKRSCSRLALLTLRCRTEMFFQNIPVLRSAYFPKKLFSFFSKTLDLQVRFAHPPMPHRTSSSSCSGVPHGLFMISHHRPCGRWCSARLIRQAETLELQLHSQPPSKRTALSPLKRSCFRFAARTLRCRTEPAFPSCSGVPVGLFGKPKRPDSSRFAVFMGATLCFFFQNAHASGSLRSPSEPRTVLSFLLH